MHWSDVAVDMFTTDAAAALGGPDWLRSRRTEAAAALGDLEPPTARLEEWRYGRIDELDLSTYRLVASPPDRTGSVPAPVEELLGRLGPLAGSIVLVDGAVVRAELDDTLAGRGVVLRSAAAADEPSDGEVIGAVLAEPPDLFSAANGAFSADPVVLDVPRGVRVELPVAVVNVVSSPGCIVFPRLAVRTGEASELSLIEVTTSGPDVAALVVPVTEISVGAASIVRHAALQELGVATWQLGTFSAQVAQDATLDAFAAALGGDYARLRLDCRLAGRGASGNLSSVYFGDGEQTLDLRTFQEHQAPDTTSNLLFKGAVADRSHSVYTGLIRIRPDARGTNAYQTNRNLKLSEHAWAESVPNLEIENNDVHCSHASTVGPVDEDQRFYLESRGVPSIVADRLIVSGFFDEVIDAVAVPQLAPLVAERVDALLDRQVGGAA